MEMFAEYHAKDRLLEMLDASLLRHAKDLADGPGPDIVDVYRLQGLAELHCYLKTVHQFDSSEVEALLQFADPLKAASLCWEENSHEYSFPICDLLRGQLHEKMREAGQRPPPSEHPKGGEAR